MSVREKDFEFIFEGVETLSEVLGRREDALQSGSRRPEKFRCATSNLFRVFIAKEEGIPELE